MTAAALALDALPTEAVVGTPTGSDLALALYGAYAAYRNQPDVRDVRDTGWLL